MSRKIQEAIGALGSSVEKLEKSCQKASENQGSKTRSPHQLAQNDLFGSPVTAQQAQQSETEKQAMTQVVDRMINRMEKLVGESR
jgi:hypothetical protein